MTEEEKKVLVTLKLFDDLSFEMDFGSGEKHTGKWDSMKAMMFSFGLMLAGVTADQDKRRRRKK